MATALPQELQPAVVSERISRVKPIMTELQKFWGFDGGNVKPVPIRTGTIDIFNDTRQVATGVIPGSASANVPPNPVGTFNYAIPEVRENIALKAEKLFNLRQMGASGNVIDQYGLNYIAEEEQFLKQKLNGFREFQTAALMRGSYTYSKVGGSTNLVHSFSGGTYTVDYKLPSTNTGSLNSSISAAWSNAGTKIVSDILAVNALSANVTGRGIRHAFCNSVVWQYIVSNTQVQNLAGSVNMPYDVVRNNDSEDYSMVLKAVPWLKFHVNDNGLELTAGTFSKFFADTQITFTVEPGPDIASYYTCPSPVVEYDGGPILGVQGEHYWYTSLRDPAAYQLNTVLSGMPVPKVPGGIFNATLS
jgi:major capsid protein E